MLTFKGIVEELTFIVTPPPPPQALCKSMATRNFKKKKFGGGRGNCPFNNNTAGFTANPVINNLKFILTFFLVYDN